MKRDNILYLVVPCYNEEEVLNITSKALYEKMKTLIKDNKISKKSKILFVDDGSKDKTWELITSFYNNDKMFQGIKLSHNKGSQNALYAGLMFARENADMAICIEADLQDDVNVIDKMLEEYDNGAEIVYGVRSSRKSDPFLKRITASAFYRFMNFIGVEMIVNHSECRLLSKVALDTLAQFSETNIFLRGMIPQLGYKTAIAYYDRGERKAGKSKFNFKKMMNFAMDGIISFSIAPLRLITVIGMLLFAISIVSLLVTLIINLCGTAISGITFIILNMWVLTGIILLSLGIIGEYIGKIQLEVKKRPRYIIEEKLIEKN